MIIDTVDLFSAPKTDNGSVAMLLKKSNGGINESLDIGLILHSAGYWSRWSEYNPKPVYSSATPLFDIYFPFLKQFN
jgi:hypothetical protein